MRRDVKYIAEVVNVRELGLTGSADLAFWTKWLEPQGLEPIDHDGSARLMFTAVDAKWMGVRFRELSIGAVVRGELGGEQQDGLHLLHAFNSSRLYAFCERRLLRTPYDHADVRVDVRLPASMHVGRSKSGALLANMSGEAERTPSSSADECWEGPIYLPRDGNRPKAPSTWFRAKLAGQTERYPFLAPDTVEFSPATGHPVLTALIESEFVAKEWSIRQSATHCRTKTFKGR